MRRSSRVLPFAAMLAVVGCAGETDPAATTTRAPDTSTTAAANENDRETAITFVSLKVPNMT